MILNLAERWAGLGSRERIIALWGGGLVAALLLYVFLIDPQLELAQRYERQSVKKQRDLEEIRTLGVEYDRLRTQLTQLEAHLPSTNRRFSLLTFIEEAATGARLRDRVTGMQPQAPTTREAYRESAVDVTLDAAQLPQLLEFFVRIEQSPYSLRIPRWQIRPKYDQPNKLDVSLRLAAYETLQ
jgi:general secretion pathway protein M